MYDELMSGILMADVFLRACPNVRSLSVSEKLGVWASAFAMQLDKLEVASYNPCGAVPKYCPALLELNLSDCDNGFPCGDIGNINWKFICYKLERLIISGIVLADNGLDKMREHCHDPIHIEIDPVPLGNGNIAGFIESYGEQLDFVYFMYMMEHEMSFVADTCRNARFHVDTADSLP